MNVVKNIVLCFLIALPIQCFALGEAELNLILQRMRIVQTQEQAITQFKNSNYDTYQALEVLYDYYINKNKFNYDSVFIRDLSIETIKGLDKINELKWLYSTIDNVSVLASIVIKYPKVREALLATMKEERNVWHFTSLLQVAFSKESYKQSYEFFNQIADSTLVRATHNQMLNLTSEILGEYLENLDSEFKNEYKIGQILDTFFQVGTNLEGTLKVKYNNDQITAIINNWEQLKSYSGLSDTGLYQLIESKYSSRVFAEDIKKPNFKATFTALAEKARGPIWSKQTFSRIKGLKFTCMLRKVGFLKKNN